LLQGVQASIHKGGDMLSRCAQVTITSLMVCGVLLAGCAKRPATTQAAAPPPTAAAATTPGGTGPAGAPPATMAPGGGTTGGGSTATPAAPGSSTASAARPVPSEFMAVDALKDVFFDFDKYDIRPNDAKTLDTNATWLKSNPNHLVLIEGHCDERGTNEYNLALGERRAKSTMNYLVSQGVQASRITIISYGEERPVCQQKTEECWAKNRRAHFLVKAR
jgi:peptidoglycan-associated lipoprotein